MSTGTVLLVDDEPHTRRVISLQLERQGHRVREASNGVQALEIVRLQAPDVVITDVNMPDMDGRELCRRLAQELGDAGPLVLVLTALPQEDCTAWVESLPNTELLDKPVSVRRLLRRVEDYLRKRGGAETGS